jgi:hypothetical protein
VVPKEADTTLGVKPDCTASKTADEGRGAADRGQYRQAAGADAQWPSSGRARLSPAARSHMAVGVTRIVRRHSIEVE